MQSNRSASNGYIDDGDDADGSAAIPELARAWESDPRVASSVRRPSTLPDSQTYHEAIETQAIFELDERQKDGSIKTIFVVPSGCTRCTQSLKQACSRARPACVRCRNAGITRCEVVNRNYHRLPGPKFGRPSTQKQRRSGTRETSVNSASTQEPTSDRSWKRSLSPGSDYGPPRKKAQGKNTLRKGNAPRSKGALPKETGVRRSGVSSMDPSTRTLSAAESTGERSAPRWKFVGRDEKPSQGPERVHSIPSDTQIPRVWCNSLSGLVTVFPELAKSEAGFSWFQSETPILLLDVNYTRGHWINSTTLSVDLPWEFSCHDYELEPIAGLDTEGSAHLHLRQPVVHSPENTLEREADTMDLQNSHLSPVFGSFPTHATVPAPLPTSSTRTLSLDDTSQDVRGTCQGPRESHVEERSPIHDAALADSWPAVQSTLPLPPVYPSPAHPTVALIEARTGHATLVPGLQERVPLDKPPEVETLLNSHLHFIPLLLWIRHNSELLPCNLPPEYAYLCMGFFFISDLRHSVVKYDADSTAGLVKGQVCWSVTLQWAPGGEDALFDRDSIPSSYMTSDSAPVDTTRDLSRPWWFDPTGLLSRTDNTTSRCPRDLRMQFSSFIPLDLLAEFHPSESFPRGWFCKSCGMINMQVFFRHQICQSTACGSTADKRIPPGKVDPLWDLRDPYQSSTLVRPITNIPLVVDSDSIIWDDGMQSWIYNAKNGVTLCHVFTGNQGHLQEDATTLLERIQGEVLLRKEDPSSSFFTHSTKLSHPSDGSETMVPRGTPDCVRVAYYTLCDLVHRYAEMDKPRFGEVRLQAWVNAGSKKGNLLPASESPVVIHCLGAELVLKFAPKRGYENISKSPALDKGKGCAKDTDRTGSPPSVGPSCLLEQDNDNQTAFISEPGANEMAIDAENVDEATTAAMDTVRQHCSADADPGMEMRHHEVVERRDRKKKVTKSKTQVTGPEICMTLVHGDCVILRGDDFECQMVRTGTTILVIGFPEET